MIRVGDTVILKMILQRKYFGNWQLCMSYYQDEMDKLEPLPSRVVVEMKTKGQHF